MNKNTRRVALSGILVALSTAILLMGGVIPAATFCGPALAGLLLVPVFVEGGLRYALSAWAAVSAIRVSAVKSVAGHPRQLPHRPATDRYASTRADGSRHKRPASGSGRRR